MTAQRGSVAGARIACDYYQCRAWIEAPVGVVSAAAYESGWWRDPESRTDYCPEHTHAPAPGSGDSDA